jgi:von Willebrand factor type A C-terminal domain/von Willebrand factor type A domain
MATWTTEVFENEYLPAGATDVHAIVSVACAGAGSAGQGGGGAAEIIVVDTSGSMGSPRSKIVAARAAADAAIDEIVDGTWFAVISGSHRAAACYPSRGGMIVADDASRSSAKEAVKHLVPEGGTAIGSWLQAAEELFRGTDVPQRHAILLTDGKNESEQPGALELAIQSATGVFQCDCRGVGEDWVVQELRDISSALLGTVDLIAEPERMPEDFRQMMRTSMARGVADAQLRVWAPQGAELLFVRQVAPNIEDLSTRAVAVSELVRDYPTGSWGDEARDYHVAVCVPAKDLGSEQLAARVQMLVGGEVVGQGLVRATWSDDSTLTTRINPAVAHYTGQAELADVIQEGLAAKAEGDDATATLKLGRAAQLAAETGNEEATNKLRRVVEITDAESGTVKLKRDASKLDEMALDTTSTKTTRVRK